MQLVLFNTSDKGVTYCKYCYCLFFLLKLNRHSCSICFSMSCGITILQKKRCDIWYCRKDSDDCRQDVLPQQTSTQPSLIFCQRRVPNSDVCVLAYQKHYFFKQQTERGGGGTNLCWILHALPLLSWWAVLGLAGVEFTFFIAACIMMYFGCETKTMLVTHHYFGHGWAVLLQCQGFLFFPLCPPSSSRLRVDKKLGGDTARTADLNQPKRCPIPYDAVPSSSSSRKGEGAIHDCGSCLPK